MSKIGWNNKKAHKKKSSNNSPEEEIKLTKIKRNPRKMLNKIQKNVMIQIYQGIEIENNNTKISQKIKWENTNFKI